jgi:hypothetical protein
VIGLAKAERLDRAQVAQTPVEPVDRAQCENPVLARLGAEGLQRLRARYADIVARIERKEMDDTTRAELNARAARLNPDAWSTPEEVAAALEQYEVVFESLRSVVGRHPRPRRV